MKTSKRLLSALCAAALALSLGAPARAAAPGYSDVKEGDWFYEAVGTVAERGLMTGAPDGTFRPEANVTRATVVTVLWRLAGSPEVENEAFPDVPEGSWASGAVAWARLAGIAAGYSGGGFGPNDPVTREQLAVFLYRYALDQSAPVAEGVVDLYSDAGYISPWALTGMKHALGAGLMTGTTVETLSPLGYATRGELAEILVRLMTPAQG